MPEPSSSAAAKTASNWPVVRSSRIISLTLTLTLTQTLTLTFQLARGEIFSHHRHRASKLLGVDVSCALRIENGPRLATEHEG